MELYYPHHVGACSKAWRAVVEAVVVIVGRREMHTRPSHRVCLPMVDCGELCGLDLRAGSVIRDYFCGVVTVTGHAFQSSNSPKLLVIAMFESACGHDSSGEEPC